TPRLRGDPFDDVVAIVSELVVEITHAFRWRRSTQSRERYSVPTLREILKRRDEEAVQRDIVAVGLHDTRRCRRTGRQCRKPLLRRTPPAVAPGDDPLLLGDVVDRR